MKKLNIVALALGLFFAGCEKDDICDGTTATTPQLVIEFLDQDNPETVKNVTDLQLIGEGGNGVITFSGVNKIKLPLKTLEDLTKYQFIINAGNIDQANVDQVDFGYARRNDYVSRACGYKTVFELNADNPVLVADGSANDGLWIKNVVVATPNIINENQTHVKIYF